MNRKYTIEKLKLNNYQNGLIIDNNKVWEHPEQLTRVNKYVTGDLHDFFDLVNDEELFNVIPDSFDLIFIGEIFHVINIQTLVYNLEYAHARLNADGIISICINEDSLKTSKTEYRKTIDRLEKLPMYKVAEKIVYVDEHAKEWTLLNLKKVANKQVTDTTLSDAIKIGSEIAVFVNKGKNINKLKTGFLQSNSNVETNSFKAAFTTNEEMLGLYVQNQIVELKPQLNKQFCLDLSDFIFNNRKVLAVFDNLTNLQEGCFVLALENYKKTALHLDQNLIAGYASTIELIWKQSMKQKTNSQLMTIIESNKE